MIKINNLFSGIPEIKIKHFLYEGCLLYCQNEVWNSIMLFADVLFNIFTGVFDVLNDVYQNVAVVLWCLYSITPNLNATICPYALIPNLNAIIRVCMLLFQTYYQGFSYFEWSRRREFQVNPRNLAKFARNVTKYMSAQHIWKLSWILGLLTCCKLANLPWNFVTAVSKQHPKTTRCSVLSIRFEVDVPTGKVGGFSSAEGASFPRGFGGMPPPPPLPKIGNLDAWKCYCRRFPDSIRALITTKN